MHHHFETDVDVVSDSITTQHEYFLLSHVQVVIQLMVQTISFITARTTCYLCLDVPCGFAHLLHD
jgi:hypothetical protein